MAIQAGQSSSPCKLDWARQLQGRSAQHHTLTLLLMYRLPVRLMHRAEHDTVQVRMCSCPAAVGRTGCCTPERACLA